MQPASPLYFFTFRPQNLIAYLSSVKTIGLTGGIGSGKTTVARIFKSMGIPIYLADNRAKALYLEDQELKSQIIQEFGNESYINNDVNRAHLSNIVFNDTVKLKTLNSLVHPKVAKDFKVWLSKQNSPYIIREAAILFESGTHKDCDQTITVSAPSEERIKRVTLRDGSNKEEIQKRMQHQLSDSERKQLADFEILNFNPHSLLEQVNSIHAAICLD